MKHLLKELLDEYKDISQIIQLPQSGSNRQYFRISRPDSSFIATIGESLSENSSFIYLSDFFLSHGLPVPSVIKVSKDGMSYLQEDFGDESLYERLVKDKDSCQNILCEVMAILPRFQDSRDFDDNKLNIKTGFNLRKINFDLNYFKYNFLKLLPLNFDEDRLQNDLDQFAAILNNSDEDKIQGHTFLFRDFQSRNVMLKGDKPYFIDFQGGYQGPVYYDVASFFCNVNPEGDLRDKMLGDYFSTWKELGEEFSNSEKETFKQRLSYFELFRYLQILGACGYRGIFERKYHFISSIPTVVKQVQSLINKNSYPFVYLCQILSDLSSSSYSNPAPEREGLSLDIMSFSYRKGVPVNNTKGMGGYVFDCRGLHNPGRYDIFKTKNGKDKEVVDFLEERGEAAVFLEKISDIVFPHLDLYLEKDLRNMSVYFGCTGGQHRSVYCAEKFAFICRKHFQDSIHINVTHRDLW